MNPVYDFKGQVSLVTGASSGIGLATAKAFAEAGAAVVLVDINENALRAATGELTSAGHPGDRRHLQRGGRGAGRGHGQAHGRDLR
jgi:NAD(P)-dependent dehydrogenase (short-subunit alcohol dehydrogenase family)